MSNTPSIDLNADLGESYGVWKIGDDDTLLPLISSANVACGYHAGDPRVMEQTVRACLENDVAIGAHPGYLDREGFGRRPMQLNADEIRTDVMYQIGALQAFCRAAGTEVRHVKPHGALYNLAAVDEMAARAILSAMVAVAPGAMLFAQPGSVIAQLAEANGIRVVGEAFADRAYMRDGTLAPRTLPGAMLSTEQERAARVRQLVHREPIPTLDGGELRLTAETICVHADTPAAVEIVRALSSTIYEAGVTIHPPK